MFGKGMFINKIRTASGGNVDLIAEEAEKLRLDFIAVKINRGYYGYNYRQTPSGAWVDDYIPALKMALDRVEIDLWGWGSCWLLDGAAEAGKAIERMKKFGLEFYMIDAEAQAKTSANRYRQAAKFSQVINNEKQFPISLCSYRYPSLHRELPWDELLECCDYHSPQVYWIHGVDPAGQLQKSMNALNELKSLPFVPAGPAFSEHGWMPEVSEVNEFDQACQDLGCKGVAWWEYDEAQDEGFFPVIGAHEWEHTPPQDLTLEEKVDLLHDAVKTYHQVSLWDD